MLSPGKNYLLTLPPSAYLIWPDSDEFFRYPCALSSPRFFGLPGANQSAVTQGLFLSGKMVERVARDWRLRAPAQNESLEDAYPLRCRLTGTEQSNTTGQSARDTKNMLIPATDVNGRRVLPWDSHRIKCARAACRIESW